MLLAIPAYASTDKLIENVKNKNLKAVEALLNSGEDVNGTNAQGNTALHYAVATNNADMVKLLLQHNADMNAQNTKGWSPLSIAEKKNVGNIYDILEAKQAKNKAAVKAAAEKAAKEKAEAEAKIAAEKEALRAKEEAVRLEAERQAAALKEQAKKAAAEAAAKAEQKKAELAAKQAEAEAAAKEKALKLQEAQASAATAKQLAEQKAKVKKNVVKPAVNTIIPLQKNTNKNKDVKLKNKKIKQAFKASPLSAKISQGDEEVVYCLQYLGLQGEQKNMTVAAGYYAVETGVSKARHDVAAAEAQKYYENASEADIKARADLCGKYITPKQAAKQNQIIRNLNKAIGF